MIGVTGGTRGRKSRPHRAGRCGRALLMLSLLIAWTALVTSPDNWRLPTAAAQTRDATRERPANPQRRQPERPAPTQPLADVRVEGNKTIPVSAIAKYIRTQPGRPVSPDKVREDVRRLYSTRWFFSVEPRYRRTEQGPVLVFKVVERPVVKRVEYRGNDKIDTKYLKELTGLKAGSPYDVNANKEAARRIESHYHEKGHAFATVELVKGGSPDHREVVFKIDEGPRVRVQDIDFKGNEFVSDALLKTKLRTSQAILWLFGGKYDPATIPDDIAALKQYYHDLGFFDVEVKDKVAFSEDRSKVYITYEITEGPRYKIRNIKIAGNRVLSDKELRQDFELTAGEHFNSRYLNADVEEVRNKYGKLGRLFAQVDPVPVFLEEPGVLDLKYRIDEDRVYRIRRIEPTIKGDNPHTKETTVLNYLLVAPGDLANPQLIKKSERRLEGSRLFERGPANGPTIKIKRVSNKKKKRPRRIFRGQNFDSPPNQNRPSPQSTTPYFGTSPEGDPFADALRNNRPPGFIDIEPRVTESRTGRLMFGVGVNSDAGVVGSIVLNESNFDILRPPTSFQDLADGTAWRGGGQRFRLEAVPGQDLSRFLMSWSDPFFLDTPYNVGVSGFYFTRFYRDWDEQRTGGRLTLGRQITPTISVNTEWRVEEVTIDDPSLPTPPILAEAVGSNFRSSVRASIAHDTRDSSFLPAEGHFVELAYEHAFGDFQYPQAEAEARQYFTLYSRPDGSGRHILSVGGEAGWTGTDTPIYDRFFAGGFQTFRGFDFRGVSPRQLGTRIGGRWKLLGSVEYMFPLVATDMIQGVVFSDFGTVEREIDVGDFRVALGAGLRLSVPAMGPVPLAFDFAVPLNEQPQDDTRVFSFFVGVNR